ncbi:pitrilysin family protein [Crossiella cryophila]|uniref:M16 family metallopeptidase n=1 Tax=Crossiella cryophila TaxID=43355 RepID=UPI0031EDE5FB
MASTAPIPLVPIVDERLKTTSVCLAVGYGSRHDPEGKGGLAHMLEHALMSAPREGGISVSEQVESLGGHANAETGPESMLYYAQVGLADAEALAGELCRAVLAPQLTETLLSSEREVVLQELAAAEADPADTVQDAFLATAFAGHPLGRPVGGTPAEVAGLTLADVLEGHRNGFLASPRALVVVGPEIPASLQHHDAAPAWPRAGEHLPLPPLDPPEPLRWSTEFSWVCLGGRSPAANSPERHPYAVLAKLLGASPTSLLYRAVRGEHGLAYAFQAWSRGYTEAGAWRLLAGVESGNGDKFLAVVREVLARVAEQGPLPADLASARNQARMSLVLNAENPLERATLTARRVLVWGPEWSLEEELAALARVTAEQVRQAAERLACELITVVRPEAR